MKQLNLLFILITLHSCASTKVVVFLNEKLDYSNYQTYRLIHYKSDDKSYAAEGMVFYTQVEQAIEENMIKKGYSNADKPDLIARYEIISSTATENPSQNYDPYSYNTFYTPRYARKYTEGIVLIELRDRKQKKLVWQGSLDLKSSRRRDVEEPIIESINKIFETYPYVAGSNEKIISSQ